MAQKEKKVLCRLTLTELEQERIDQQIFLEQLLNEKAPEEVVENEELYYEKIERRIEKVAFGV